MSYDIPGYYYDPNHGGCLRTIIRINSTTYHIIGVYGHSELRPIGDWWTATLTIKGAESHGRVPLTVTFHKEKKDPQNLVMQAWYVVRDGRIEWSDDNCWRPMYHSIHQFNHTKEGRNHFIGTNRQR